MTGAVGGQASGGVVPPAVTAREPFGDWSYDAIKSHVDQFKPNPIDGRAQAWKALGQALAQQEQSLQDDIARAIGSGWEGVGAQAAQLGVASYAKDGIESARVVEAIGAKVAESGTSLSETISRFPARIDDGVTGVSSLVQGIGHFIGFGDGPAGPSGWHQGLISSHNQELNQARAEAQMVMTTTYQPGVAASDNGVPALTKPVDPLAGGQGGGGNPSGGGSPGGSTGVGATFGTVGGGGGTPGGGHEPSVPGDGSPSGQVSGAGDANQSSGAGTGRGNGMESGAAQSSDPAGTSAAGWTAPAGTGPGDLPGLGGVGSAAGGAGSATGGFGGTGSIGGVGGGFSSLGGMMMAPGSRVDGGGAGPGTGATVRPGTAGGAPSGRAASSSHSMMPRGGHHGEDDDEEYRPASYLVSIDNGNELIGELPKVVPPVIGA